MSQRLRVAVEAPQHSGLNAPLDYLSEGPIAPGSLVRVPLGRRELAGIVWPGPGEADAAALDEAQLRPVLAVLDALPPLSPRWCELVEFAASYYQRSIGEVALSLLPPAARAHARAAPGAAQEAGQEAGEGAGEGRGHPDKP